MHKGLLVKITAVVVCLWYVFTIIGFGVHTCKTSDRSFIVTAQEETSGCPTIHPGMSCSADEVDHCFPHHTEEDRSAITTSGLAVPVVDASSCCSDEFQQFEGIGVRSERMYDEGQDILQLHASAQVLTVVELLPVPTLSSLCQLSSAPFPSICKDFQSAYRIYRI